MTLTSNRCFHHQQYQIWTCKECLQDRQWGFMRPDREMVTEPRLTCCRCRKATVHTYSRIVLDMESHPEIDFGDRSTRDQYFENRGYQ